MRLLLFRGLFKSFVNSTGHMVSDDGTSSTLEGRINPHIGTHDYQITWSHILRYHTYRLQEYYK